MPEFNRMTIVAASEVIEYSHTQNQFTSRVVQWGVENDCGQGALLSRTNSLAQVAIDNDRQVCTPTGSEHLSRAVIDHAISEHPHRNPTGQPCWNSMVAGLRLDGFEVCKESYETGETSFLGEDRFAERLVLRRMLPANLRSVGVRDAQSELEVLLVRLGLNTAKGHFDQAIAAFSRGEWAASNAQIRTCFEAVVHETASNLGIPPQSRMDLYLKEMGALSSPFLYTEYNEWHQQDQKTQYLKGMWARLHPQGSHPGLSEEDDCTFRLQIVAITLRLLLRRLDKRQSAL